MTTDTLTLTCALIHVKVLLRKYPPGLIGTYLQISFPELTPDDIEHVIENARKCDFMVNKEEAKP